MKKQFILINFLFVFVLLGILSINVNASSFTDGDFTLIIESNNDITITGYNGAGGALAIPSTFTDSNSISRIVTAIGNNAFENNSITSITIPSSITSIGSAAFKANSFSSISIPTSVEFIGDNAFTNNNSLASVDFNGNDSITSLGNAIFSGTSLASINPTSLNMGINLFKQLVAKDETFMENQTSATLDLSSITSIGNRTFSWGSMSALTIPSSVTSIGEGAFQYNDIATLSFSNRTTAFTSLGNAVFSGNNLVTINTSTLGLNDTVLIQLIETDATFSENVINSLTLPASLTSIGNYTFGDNEIATLTFPTTLTTIEDEAFSANYLEDLVFPASLTTIGAEAFLENYLTEITIPTTITSLGNLAFGYNLINAITFEGDTSVSLFAPGFLDEDGIVAGKSTFSSTYSHWEDSTYIYSSFDPDRYDTNGTLLAGTYSFNLSDANTTNNPNLDIWSFTTSAPSTPGVTPPTNTTPTTPQEPLPQTGVSESYACILGLGALLYFISKRIKYSTQQK